VRGGLGRRASDIPRVYADRRGADQRGGAMRAPAGTADARRGCAARGMVHAQRPAPTRDRNCERNGSDNLIAVLLTASALLTAQAALAQAPIETVHVQGNVHMLIGAGGNIAVQIGEDGILVVDTGSAERRDD